MNSLCFGLESPWFFFAATAQIIIIVCFVFASYKHLQTNMASTSSPTSSPTTPSWKRDVFLSFSGKDTRNSFTSHLHAALKRNQIDAFIDKQLDGGEKLEPALLKRIEDSHISVVIFSENYADSTFCLRELSKILECHENKGQMVLPVFHQLDPSHVQDLTGSYGEALSRHERDCASEEVESWRHALKEIANLKGWDSSVIKDETKLIKKIVSDIQKKLLHAPSTSIDAKGPVGMQSRVEHIESLFSKPADVVIVGIWGMGGIGKSTTAEAVYKRNSHKFEGRYFFRNVGESKKDEFFHVILHGVLETKVPNIHTTELSPHIKRMLQRKKVLIVLDDVKNPRNLNFLVGEDGLFGKGSRIIVTSRDRQVLINACQQEDIYEVKELDGDDALRLFSFHAFKQSNPPDEFTTLSKDVVSCVNGIPLVLEVLGASLYKKTRVEYWESKVAQLRKNGGEDIKKCLEMCYHDLDRTEKKIFLDIACFFVWCTRDYLQQTLDLEERSGIDRLIDMCLIKIVENEIRMHDVLLKLGRDIVVQENVDPRERSRLWDAVDVKRVLKTQGTGKVESISVYLSETTEINASPAAFEGMYNLRLLRFDSSNFSSKKSVRIHLPQGLHSLSNELRILDWSDYPLKSFPSDFFPEKLVVLEMPRSELEQLWKKKEPLKKLKLMNLKWSSKLILSDFDFSNLPNLEVLNLQESQDGLHANNLCTLPPSIRFLSQLVKLDLSYCSSLTCLPDSIGELKSLEELNLFGCSKLASLPSSIGKLTCLVKLGLGVCSELAILPESIGELKSLVKLDLCNCQLASLPESIGELKSLVKLGLNGCSKLASLPNSIYGLESLESFDLGGCYMLEGFSSLNPRRSEVEEVASTINKLGCLQRLNMENLGMLEIPGSIGSCVSLKILKFSGNDFKRIPANIKQLPMLIELYLDGCKRLQHLPQLPSSLRVLIASGCISLTSVAGISMQGEKDYEAASQHFNFSNCPELDQSSLTKIIGDARSRIERMATSMVNQQYFSVRLCIPLSEVPEWFTYKNTEGPTVQIPAHRHRANTTDQLFCFTLCAVVSFGPCEEYPSEEYPLPSEEYLREEYPLPSEEYLREEYPLPSEEYLSEEYPIPSEEYPIPSEEYLREEYPLPSEEYLREEYPLPSEEYPSEEYSLPSEDYSLPSEEYSLPLDFDIKCECHLITKDETQSDLSFHYYEGYENRWGKSEREHVFIWSIHSDLFFKEASFHFKLLGENTAYAVVQSGVHPLFVEQQQPKRPKLMGNA